MFVPQQIIICYAILFQLSTVAGYLDTSTIELARDYFAYKGVRVVRSFMCSKHDSILLAKTLQTSGKFWMVLGNRKESTFPLRNPYVKWKRDVYTADYCTFGIFMDYDCHLSKQVFNESSEQQQFNTRHQWLVWSSGTYANIEHAGLNVDTELTWANPDTSLRGIDMYDLYKINFTWPIIATPAGHWDRENGLIYNITSFKYLRRENLQHLNFDTAVAVYNYSMPVENVHEHLITHEEDNFTTIMTKTSYAQYFMLHEKFNFTITLYMTDTSNFAPFENGSYQGQIGMMQRNEAKISPSPLLFYRARDVATEFVAPTWTFDTAAMFRHPKVTAVRNALLQPFTVTVWLCVIGTWILVLFTLKIAAWLESTHDSEESILESSWSATMLATVGAVSEQGSEMESKSVTFRIVLLFTMVQVVLLNNYYGGGVVSSLLTEPAKTIRSIQNLIDCNLQIGYENVSHNRGFFEHTTDPLVHELYRKKVFPPTQSYPNTYRVDIGVKKMKEEPFVFQVEQIQAYPHIDNIFTDSEKCALTEISLFTSMVGPTYLLMQKGLPYKDMMAYGHRQIWERGLMKYKWHEWQPPKPRCLLTRDVVSVEINTISFAYFLLVFGIIASVSILIIERLYYDRDCLKKEVLKLKTRYIPKVNLSKRRTTRTWNPLKATTEEGNLFSTETVPKKNKHVDFLI